MNPKVLVLSVEGLGTNLVGCYGAAIAPTPNLDRFAARSIVLDQFWLDTVHVTEVLRSIWTGTHFAHRLPASSGDLDLESMSELKTRGLLITDNPQVAAMAEDVFRDVLLFEEAADDTVNDDDSEAGKTTETRISRLVSQALERWFESLSELPILWIHSLGLNYAWDAPYEWRTLMCDEGDPDPPRETTPANMLVDANTDPDIVFGWACAAGAQAMALDQAWELLEDAVEEVGIADECLVMLGGIVGYPLGEHGRVGNDHAGNEGDARNGSSSSSVLYSERLHVPWIIRPGTMLPLGLRVPFMVQPYHVHSALARWLTSQDKSADVLQNDATSVSAWPIEHRTAFSVHDRESHLVVPSWSCKIRAFDDASTEVANPSDEQSTAAVTPVHLFAMPDDRWQQNEVAMRAPNIVDAMVAIADVWAGAENVAQVRASEAIVSMDSELLHAMR